MESLPTGLQALISSAPPQLSALPAGTALTALVHQVLVPGQRYQVDIRGLLLELEMKLMLQVGQRIPLRVKASGPNGVVLTSSPAPAAPAGDSSAAPQATPETAVRAAGLPVRPDTIRAARALSTVGGPTTTEAIHTLAEAIRAAPPETPATPAPASDAAAAYLVTRGIPATPSTVARMAPIFNLEAATFVPTQAHLAAADPTAVASDVAGALRAPPLDLPAGIENKSLPQLLDRQAAHVRALPDAVPQAVAAAIQSSPALAAIDTAIGEILARLAESPAAPAQIADDVIARLIAELLERLSGTRAEAEIRQWVRALPASRTLLTRLRAALEDAEIAELKKLPELSALREVASRPELAEPADRAAAFRLVNTLAMLQGEGTTIIEVPIRTGPTEPWSRALLIFRRGGKRAATFEGFESFTVDVSMSRIGRVLAHVGLSRHTASVRFQVRGASEQRLFEDHQAELVDALKANGFDATVSVHARGEAAEAPSLAEGLRSHGLRSVDFVA